MRLLVVEDDRALGEVLRRGLSEEGYAVDLAGSVAAAEAAFAVNRYELAVVDLGLPDGDGAELCRRWRAEGSSVRVLMLTARAAMFDKVSGLDAGADDYVTKPFDFPELCARLRALLRRPAGVVAAVVEVADVRLDPASHQVWRGATVVPLTTKEFSLLELLLRNTGHVVSKNDILESCWDEHYDGLSNVVEVHVASIRRKLDLGGDPAGGGVSIETVRGVGYRLVEMAPA